MELIFTEMEQTIGADLFTEDQEIFVEVNQVYQHHIMGESKAELLGLSV